MALPPGNYDFESMDGDPFSINLPAPSDKDSFFVFSLTKAGSTLLDNIMRSLCDSSGIPYVTIADDAFSCGVTIPRITRDIEKLLIPTGFAYLGFRHFFSFEPQFEYSRHRKLLLVRDPRDMLVSLYFSLKHSHTLPSKGMALKGLSTARQRTQSLDIDGYISAQATSSILSAFNRYQEHIFDDKLRIYRYEDIIFDKWEWVKNIVEYLALDVSDAVIERTAKRFDIIPVKENPAAHIRQVTPGNYKKHLSTESIEKLNSIFAKQLDYFGYDV